MAFSPPPPEQPAIPLAQGQWQREQLVGGLAPRMSTFIAVREVQLSERPCQHLPFPCPAGAHDTALARSLTHIRTPQFSETGISQVHTARESQEQNTKQDGAARESQDQAANLPVSLSTAAASVLAILLGHRRQVAGSSHKARSPCQLQSFAYFPLLLLRSWLPGC
ncbi:Hypothetical predicted protein [Podarcis lilfordi]|uniref:Uncharacterized protein n=1 Tax=Podarcis lilfordi TaxID=74358 RepID=A0AA35KQ15_9SAUR|nr:Hypothetical predicted protein [Podarcis lilfordi]